MFSSRQLVTQRAQMLLVLAALMTALAMGACGTPTVSEDVRAQGRRLVQEETRSGRPALGRIPDAQAPAYWFIYDPDGLVAAALALGENPARLYSLGEGTFARICRELEPRWYYCKIS